MVISYTDLQKQRTTAVMPDITQGTNTSWGFERRLALSATQEVYKWVITPFCTLAKMQHTKHDRIITVVTGRAFVAIENKAVRKDLNVGDAFCIDKDDIYIIGTLAAGAEIIVSQPAGYNDKVRILGTESKAFETAPSNIVELKTPIPEYTPITMMNRAEEIAKMTEWRNQNRPVAPAANVIGNQPAKKAESVVENPGGKLSQFLKPEVMAEYEAYQKAPPVETLLNKAEAETKSKSKAGVKPPVNVFVPGA